MKRLALILAVIAASSCSVAYDMSVWNMQREGSTQSYTVKVPCTVAGALNQAGVFGPGVFEQQRYSMLDKSLYDAPWVFSTKFSAQKGLCHVLRFGSLGYSADIEVNGVRIAAADTTAGVFITREYDITRIARSVNTLKVTVHRAPAASLNHGFVDWNPRPVDESMGILGDVSLISTPDVQIRDVFVKPELDLSDLKQADLLIRATLVNRSSRPVNGTFKGEYEGGSFSADVSLAPGETRTLELSRHMVAPRIWWTREMGRPELYTLRTSFISGGTVSHSRADRFGVRSITSELTPEGHRQFVLNGRPVLIKAGGWTDDLLMQDSHESLRRQLDLVANMGLNCIRFENIWGKDDKVYDLCDSLGIMALVGWSCQWEWEQYCGYPEDSKYGCITTPETESLALRYFRDQLIRLRNHASVIGWLSASDRIPNPDLERKYYELYKQLEYRPYICSAGRATSSVSGPSGTKMAGPYEYVGPDYWYLDTKCGGAFGFNTETGVGLNMPQLESVSRMVGPDHLWPLDTVWDYHCTASTTDMNSTRAAVSAVTGLYGAPEGVEDFIRKAHAIDYDSTRSMFEAFRCKVPEATGIVQWMLNSAWPSLYWQLYDWYLVPTAGYYGTKKACEPLQLIYNYADRCVYGVNDSRRDTPLTAVLKVYGPDSKLIRSEEKQHKFEFRKPKKVFETIEGPCFVALELRDKEGHVVADNFYCVPEANNSYAWEKSNWYVTPISGYADMGFVSKLPQAALQMQTQTTAKGFSVRLTNSSEVVAYQNILKAKASDGSLVPAALWSDNFFSLAPGESRLVSCTLPEGSGPASVSLSSWNGVLTQAPDSLDRNLSAYATYDFSFDDEYTGSRPYETVTVEQPKGKKVKNVIMMIGDGMGFEHVSCAWVVNGGHLNMDAMPYFGASRTYATDRLITDSCAGGNALATGVKTRYGHIGLGPDGSQVTSVLKDAQAKGMKTGITVTCRINDATPADYVAHSNSRKDEEGIAAQFVDSGVDFISGGGLHFWTSRSDGRNLVEEMQARGYTFVEKVEDIASATGDKFLGLYEEYDLKTVDERGPALLESTRKALQMLDNRKGFFLMIEGSDIDSWSHRNKIGLVCEEVLDFDRTLGEVLKFAERDGQTLVVVTADHATGGLTLLKGSIEDQTVKVNFSTKGHNGIIVPVFAYGPGAQQFAGVHENGEIGQIIRRLLK